MTHRYHLERFDLSELVHVQATRPGPSTIVLQNRRGHVGHISITGGQIVHASVGSVHGEEALFAIFSWELPGLVRITSQPAPKRTIHAELQPLMIDAYWRGEELRAERAMQDTQNLSRAAFFALLRRSAGDAPPEPAGQASSTDGSAGGSADDPADERTQKLNRGALRALVGKTRQPALDRKQQLLARLDQLDDLIEELREDSEEHTGPPIPLAPRPAFTAPEDVAAPGTPPCLRLDALESLYGELSELQEAPELQTLNFRE